MITDPHTLSVCLGILAGLLIGSFLNVCIHRMPRDLSVVRPRSHCPQCETTIGWYDNIPVLSYLLLGGKCRKCKARISPRYPIVELLTAALFAMVCWRFGMTMMSLKGCLLSALLVGLLFADLETLILPDEFTIGGTVLGLAMAAVSPLDSFFARMILPETWNPRLFSVGEGLLAVIVAAGSLWLVGELYYRIRKREGLGFGDVKMVAMIGAFLGLPGTLVTLILGSVLGSIIGLGFILLARKDAATYELPFGTFLGAAALVTGVIGPSLFGWPRGIL